MSFFSVSVSVQSNEQDLTYGDEFHIFYEVKSAVLKTVTLCFENYTFIFNLLYFCAQKLPVKDSQSLNYHNKCSPIKPTSTYRSVYEKFSLERGSGWVDDQRPSIWTEAVVTCKIGLTIPRLYLPAGNYDPVWGRGVADTKDVRGYLSKTVKR